MAVFKETNPQKIPKRFKNAKECFYFRCSYIDIYGNKKRKQSEYYLREKYAKEAERDFLNKFKNSAINSKITIGELIDDFLSFKNKKLKITSINTLNIRLHYLSTLKKIVVEEFNIDHFNRWKTEIDSLEVSTTYKNNIYKTLRSVLNYGRKMHDLNIKILSKMSDFTNNNELKKEMLFYTKDEFDKFISCEEDLKWKCFFSTLFYCGIRQGEALALNWNDINFENNTLKITKSLATRIKGKRYIVLPPKTPGSNRTIPIPLSLSEMLKERYNKLKKYSNFANEWFIFGDIFPLATTTIQVRRDKLCKLSKQKRIRIHDFRHSCASLLISKGANITLVAKYLGHDNTSTTLNTYSHFYKNDLEDLIKNIDMS